MSTDSNVCVCANVIPCVWWESETRRERQSWQSESSPPAHHYIQSSDTLHCCSNNIHCV